MSALTACRGAAFTASAPDNAAASASDVGGALQDGNPPTAAGGADRGGRSFQQMMNNAADAPADAGRAGTRQSAAVAGATTDGDATSGAGTTAGPDALTSPAAAVGAADAAGQATAAGAEPVDTAESTLAALALAGLLPTSTAGTADASSTKGARTDDGATSSAQDTDPMTDGTLATILASLAQLGFVPQSVAATTTPAADAAGTPALAIESQIASGSGAGKAAAAPLDQVLSRMRPALSAGTAVNAAPADAAVNAGTRMDATGGQIVLRDLLDGNGRDATLARDPADTAVAITRTAESAVASATAGTDGTRAADTVTRTIDIPLQHPRWADAVATSVRWFAEQGVQNATLRLSPEHLGPVEVRVAISDGQVNVNFTAANADTRTALEQSLPRLRDMLAGAGLSLGEAQVQQQMRQGSQNSFNSGGGPADTDVRDTLTRVPMRLGLVDEYA